MFTLQTSFKPLFLKRERGEKSILEVVKDKGKTKLFKTFVSITSTNSASVQYIVKFILKVNTWIL
jgi:hypothetical protein